jgi:hypothetical protein
MTAPDAKPGQTPRTDAEANAEGQGRMSESVSADFARTLERENAELAAALEKLRNEADGMLSFSEELLRQSAGNTNVAVFQLRITEATAALANRERT